MIFYELFKMFYDYHIIVLAHDTTLYYNLLRYYVCVREAYLVGGREGRWKWEGEGGGDTYAWRNK